MGYASVIWLTGPSGTIEHETGRLGDIGGLAGLGWAGLRWDGFVVLLSAKTMYDEMMSLYK